MYGTTAALPFGTIVIIIVIWALVTFPLTVVGGIMGKNTKVCVALRSGGAGELGWVVLLGQASACGGIMGKQRTPRWVAVQEWGMGWL